MSDFYCMSCNRRHPIQDRVIRSANYSYCTKCDDESHKDKVDSPRKYAKRLSKASQDFIATRYR